jgi:hypothetical protein
MDRFLQLLEFYRSQKIDFRTKLGKGVFGKELLNLINKTYIIPIEFVKEYSLKLSLIHI